MAHYDGSIKFDTSIDSRKFESGVQKLKATALKGMAVVGTAFTTAAGFAVNLASDLQEVQNVVDITFGDKAAEIETWAKNAASAFGLSELQAKQFNGTMGAMVKSMGLSDTAVLEMSTTLTGLAADFASFYNLEHQEAFDKIRAGISGETEPLKQLGINMSVANLEAYALTQGITKSYNAMSQAEQATLRYNYLLHAGADAQGDFARTSDSFANQLKIAKLNVTELGAEFGDMLLPIASQGLKELSDATTELRMAIAQPELKSAIEDTGELLISLIDAGVDLATAVIPPLISTLGFLGKNMRTVATISATLIAAYKAYAIVNSVTGWISANNVALALNAAGELGVATATGVETAALTAKNVIVGVLTGQITVATATQWLWNAAISANPIGLAVAATVAFVAAIAALCLTEERETEQEKLCRENIQKTTKALNDATDSYKEYKNQQAESTNQNIAEINNIERLSKELLNLADSNGIVADSDKARAQFIINELNSALGTEYSMTGNIINRYSDLKKNIYDLIEAKRYEILMNEASKGYENAIKNESDALTKVVKARKEYAEATQEQKEQAKANLAEAEKHYQKLLSDRMMYEDAVKIKMQQGTQAAIDFLTEQREAYASAESGVAEYVNKSEKALATAGNAYQISLEKLFGALEQYNSSGSDSAKALVEGCLKELEKSKQKYEAAGGMLGKATIMGIDGTYINVTNLANGITEQLSQAISNGLKCDYEVDIGILNTEQVKSDFEKKFNLIVAETKPQLSVIEEFGLSVSDTAISTVSDRWTSDTLSPIGLNFAKGIASGINLGRGPVREASAGLANLAIRTPMNLLVIRSPSQVMRDRVGKMIPLGMAVGIKENSDAVVKAFDSMLDIVDYHRKLDIISEDEYYTEVEKLRDEYFAEGTKEWLDYTEEIYSYQKKQLEKEKELYKETYDDIFDYTSDKIDAVIEKQKSYANKLKSYGSLFTHVKINLDDEDDIDYYRLSDLKKDTEALKQYNELMTSARAKVLESGISKESADSFLSELHNFDIDEGTRMLKVFLDTDNNELNEYLKAYEEKLDFSDQASATFYKDEMNTAVDESVQYMKDKLKEAGFEIPETFFDAGKDAAIKFGDAFSEEIDVELDKIKEKIESFKAKIKVDVDVSLDKASGGTTVYKYYGNNTYQLGSSGETTQQRLEAIRNDEEFRRMSGEGD